MTQEQRENLKKRLLYKSANRGCKETDIIFERFLPTHIDSMNINALLSFEKILNEDDGDIYDWIIRKKTPPPHLDRDMIRQMAVCIIPKVETK